MKKLFAILFCALLLWMEIAPLSATVSPPPCCTTTATDSCPACCGKDCCADAPSPNSKPAPAVPAKSGGQDQISLLAASFLVLTLPTGASPSLSSAVLSPSPAHAPIYARDCALRL